MTRTIKLRIPEDNDKMPAVGEELKNAVLKDLVATFDRAAKIAKRMKPGTERVLRSQPVEIRLRKYA